jgi:DNA-binding SARP family transcriptional activator
MARTRFQMLGPVAVFRDDDEIDIGFPKQRLILAILLASAGRPVPTASLIERLWGAEPPRTARNALYTYVSNLRSALARLDLALVKRGDGYVARVERDTVDMHRFRALVAEAKRSACETAVLDLLSQALCLYGGSPLDGLAGPWAEATRAGLEAERRWALIRCNEILLRRGQHAEILGELNQAVARAPFDELLAEQFMKALHYSGLRAAALSHYHQTRTILGRELGIDPSPSLQNLYQEILRDDDPPGAPPPQ